jgi:hypothetical protein
LTEVPLATALQSNDKPMSWPEVAAGVLGFFEEQVKNADYSRWPDRERAVRQLIAYSQ